ncbi:unnamed protein product [Schistosoma curassoni]|uniref:Uncharacterized protein n=1 Tax=Schistosoma curassoni TaxID=6186 RepID=A0A183KVT3_9TREM|nr:unnamed protein product [Schistosoma curassoni]
MNNNLKFNTPCVLNRTSLKFTLKHNHTIQYRPVGERVVRIRRQDDGVLDEDISASGGDDDIPETTPIPSVYVNHSNNG